MRDNGPMVGLTRGAGFYRAGTDAGAISARAGRWPKGVKSGEHVKVAESN
jgi:hypothetical protein